MDRNNQHIRQLMNMRKALFDQGFVDEQFVELEKLQDDASPNFVEEIATLFYRDSTRLILNIEQALVKNPLDFIKLEAAIHQFKGSTTSIGAKKVKSECMKLGEHCKSRNGGGCKRSFQQLKMEHAVLKSKLEAYFQMARQIGPMTPACRPK